MDKTASISVFFPAYNDAGTIASMVITAILTLETLTDDYEVIVINDGSVDHTREVLEELARRYSCLRVIDHGVNRGYGAALRTGFANCTKEWIFYTDGDAQYDVRELKKLVPLMTEGIDVVNGYKIGRSDPLYRTLIGLAYRFAAKLLFRIKIKDIDCDFRLIRRRVFDRIQLTSPTGSICVELIKKIQDAGFRIAEVPVHHYYRAYGRSQFFTFGHVLKSLIELVRLWWQIVVRKEQAAAAEMEKGPQAPLLAEERTLAGEQGERR